MKSVTGSGLSFLLILLISCESENPAGSSAGTKPDTYYPENMTGEILGSARIEFYINEIPLSERFYSVTRPYPVQTNVPFDEDSIPLYEVNGELYYHPVYLGRLALWYLSTYVYNNDERSLYHAENITRKVLEEADEIDSAMFFPYDFSTLLHNEAKLKRNAPWYSGMAQGRMLTVVSRLYAVTSNPEYLERANDIFNSFFVSPNTEQPWVSLVDEENFFWIEEYPDWPDPNFTLNGFGATIFGLYDYYLISDNPMSEVVLKSSLTTIRENINKYRVENELSLYCLAHKVQRELYHNIHIKQLTGFYSITSDSTFLYWADVLRSDY